MPPREINKAWVKERLADLGLTQAALAAHMGWAAARVTEILQGKRRVEVAEAVRIADFLRTDLSTIHSVLGIVTKNNYGRLLLAGYIDATSGSITLRVGMENALEEIDAPFPGYLGRAVRIKGRSMDPRYRDGEVICFTPDGQDISHLLGGEAVIETEDGRLLLKILQKGTEKDRYTLVSLNRDEEPIQNIAVRWAAQVDFLIPRRI